MHQAILRKFENNFRKIDLSLERITNFLTEIGNPHHKLPSIVHFAGTNGKGSTIAFLRAILEGNGKTCHVYTSPHLIKFNERIVLAGQEIADDYLERIITLVEEKSKGHNLTYFELTTAAAFIAFSETKADYLLLETGLGGRLDATNIVPNKKLTIITPISFDHMEYLGNTLTEIAAEKAGIVTNNAPCIIAPQQTEVLNYFRQNIHNLIEAPILPLENLPLNGQHQIINASVAIAAAKFLGFTNFDGIKNAKWPARLQKIRDIGNFELWLDSAHNEGGAQVLAESIIEPIYMISGMLKTKNAAAFLKNFIGKVKMFYGVDIEDEPNCLPATELAAIAKKQGIPSKSAENIEMAIADIVQSPASGKIIICGSIYLAGKFLEKEAHARTTNN